MVGNNIKKTYNKKGSHFDDKDQGEKHLRRGHTIMDWNQDERIIGMGYCQPVFMGNKCEWDDRMIGDMMGHMRRETK